jgi:hypothetical protein
MAISDDWTIDYNNRRIYHSSGTTIYSVNALYSYLMDAFDESGTIDDTVPMTAQTPTSYTLVNGWFINYCSDTAATNDSPYPSFQFLNGGGIKTTGWKATTNAVGVRILSFGTYTAEIVAADIGRTITGASSSHTGVILDFDNTTKKWWVRVNSLANTFNVAENITITGGTAGTRTTTGASATGENLWINLYTLGTIESNTQIYLYQNHNSIIPWWTTGHIDVLIPTIQTGTEVDNSLLSIYARQYSKLYDSTVVDTTGGGRFPAPIATFSDINNPTGFWTFTGSSGSATLFTVGEAISYSTTTFGVITAVGGTSGAPILTYYLYRYSFTNFANGNTPVTGASSGATCTAGIPTAAGPAALAGITFTFGTTSQNLNNGNGARPYALIINCNNLALASVYQYLKYYVRYGNSTTLNGHAAEEYDAVGDYRLVYASQTSNFVDGETITGVTSGATAVVVSDYDQGATGALIIRDMVGTIRNSENINSGGTLRAVANIPSGLGVISPNKQAPFGSFAGSKFFGARGVWLSNVLANDQNNYELIDSEGFRQVPPQTIALTVIGLATGDRVAVFKTTGNNNIVDKNQFSVYAYQGAAVGFVRITGVAPADTPLSGNLCLVRRDATAKILTEERFAYSAWTDHTTYTEFTLTGVTVYPYSTLDTAYVPYIDAQSSGASVSASLVYTADRYVTTRVRRLHYLPFIIAGQITTAGLTVSAIKTADTIAD